MGRQAPVEPGRRRPTRASARGDLNPLDSDLLLHSKKASSRMPFTMQEMGFEPTRYCYHRHLKPARLPFRHSCAQTSFYPIVTRLSIEVFKMETLCTGSIISYDIAVSGKKIFVRYQSLKAYRAACMKLSGGNAHFGSETVSETVRKSC